MTDSNFYYATPKAQGKVSLDALRTIKLNLDSFYFEIILNDEEVSFDKVHIEKPERELLIDFFIRFNIELLKIDFEKPSDSEVQTRPDPIYRINHWVKKHQLITLLKMGECRISP